MIDAVLDNLSAEPLEVTAQMEADLNALYENPPRVIPNPMDEVRPETRKALVEALVVGGRTRAQANTESEFAVRMAANITRSTGESVEAFLTKHFISKNVAVLISIGAIGLTGLFLLNRRMPPLPFMS